jgi:hypothetical protein
VAVLVGAAVVFGVIKIPGLDLSGITLPFSVTDGGSDGKVDVNKLLKFAFTDEWAGTAANAKTFYVYDGTTKALLESLTTDADGTEPSVYTYPTGTKLFVKFVDANDKVWYDVTVPGMLPNDADAATYNTIALKDFEIGTYTGDDLKAGAITFADASTYNQSSNGSTPIFVYSLSNSGADNTGLVESYDPVYGCAWDVWVTGTISGTNASSILVNGVDYQFSVGTTTYFADKINAQALSKWKIGPSYVTGYEGQASCSFGLDLTGYLAASSCTMQLTVYANADPAYAMSHAGNFGVDKVTLAEQTVTIIDV